MSKDGGGDEARRGPASACHRALARAHSMSDHRKVQFHGLDDSHDTITEPQRRQAGQNEGRDGHPGGTSPSPARLHLSFRSLSPHASRAASQAEGMMTTLDIDDQITDRLVRVRPHLAHLAAPLQPLNPRSPDPRPPSPGRSLRPGRHRSRLRLLTRLCPHLGRPLVAVVAQEAPRAQHPHGLPVPGRERQGRQGSVVARHEGELLLGSRPSAPHRRCSCWRVPRWTIGSLVLPNAGDRKTLSRPGESMQAEWDPREWTRARRGGRPRYTEAESRRPCATAFAPVARAFAQPIKSPGKDISVNPAVCFPADISPALAEERPSGQACGGRKGAAPAGRDCQGGRPRPRRTRDGQGASPPNPLDPVSVSPCSR